MMSNRVIGVLLIGCLTSSISCARALPPAEGDRASRSEASGPGRLASAATSAIWDDGLAEIAVYDAHWSIYGKDRVFQARLITAKEPFDLDRGVKADPPYAGRRIRDVFKENLVMEIQTENYPYRFLRTVFVARDDPDRLLKATVGSQEWCGNTFHLFRFAETGSSYEHHSYFDGEADGTAAIEVRPGDLFRDQLFTTLRFVSPEITERRIRLWPSWLTNRARPVHPVDAVLRATGAETISAAGQDWACHKFTIEADAFSETYWFSDAPDPVLVRYQASDGRAFHLKEIVRRDYWTRR